MLPAGRIIAVTSEQGYGTRISDEIVDDMFSRFLLPLEPRRHAAAARPRLAIARVIEHVHVRSPGRQLVERDLPVLPLTHASLPWTASSPRALYPRSPANKPW